MTFINDMQQLAITTNQYKKDEAKRKEEQFNAACKKRITELMTFLTEKYHDAVKSAIIKASENGYREKYMNFNYNDFKANFRTLGKPSCILNDWLVEMSKPDSIYVPKNEDDEPIHFDGLDFDVWNNGAFTVHFTW